MNAAEFCEQVVLAKEHKGGKKIQACLGLDAAWFARIRDEVVGAVSAQPPSDVTAASHPTYWTAPYGDATQHSLYNASGNTADTSTDHNHQLEGKSFNARCPELARFFAPFQSRALNFRVNALGPGSGLSPHEEIIDPGGRLRLRFHLPIVTNEHAFVVLDDERFQMQPGYLYFFNNGCVHAAENHGSTRRYHVVFDLFFDPWIWENVLDSACLATPAPGLRKLSDAEGAVLARGAPHRIEEHLIGTATGVVLKARRVRDEAGEETWKKTPT